MKLYRKLASSCTGSSNTEVIDAAGNLLVNALRQGHAKREDALATFERVRDVLMKEYEQPHGSMVLKASVTELFRRH